jgi:hypothetical protein
VHRTLAILGALVMTISTEALADRSQLIQLLDASFKCSRERERFDAGWASSDIKYQYRFFADDGSFRITTHYLVIAYEVPAQGYHSVEQHQVATARFADIEVFHSQDPASDTTVYISCKSEMPCISNYIVWDKSWPTAQPRAGIQTGSRQLEREQQFDGFGASYFFCDAQTAEYVRAALDAIIGMAKPNPSTR